MLAQTNKGVQMGLLFKAKIKKQEFVNKLIEMFGFEGLSKCSHSEMNASGNINMTLYYVDSVHAGTWCKGEGWIFEHIADKIKKKVSIPMLAAKFSTILSSWLSEEEMQEVVKRNQAETDRSVCHSHDFCDANMAMQEAVESFGLTINADSDADAALWNAAWDLAKKSNFTKGDQV